MEGYTPKQESFESQKQKALQLAQALSHKLNLLPKGSAQAWQAEDPDLAHIFNMTDPSGGKTGVQKYFENEMVRIDEENSNVRGTYIHRLIQDLDRWNRSADDILATK